MRLVAGRWTRAAVATCPEVGAALNNSRRHQLLRYVACSLGQRRRARRNIEHDPMPPAAAGRRVRIIHSDGEALGAARCSTPTQRGREVVPGAAEALEDLFICNGAAFLDV